MKRNSLEVFLEKINSGKTVIGTCITLTDVSVTEAAVAARYDFCWIDMEHGNIDRNDVAAHIIALTGTDCAPIVRVPWNEHGLIKSVIDLAPAGILVPMVNTPEEAARVVSSCRYPPVGMRSCGFRRATGYGMEPLEPYLLHSQSDPLVLVQIEHRQAVQNLDDILSVPGLDGICIGPYDLSASVNKYGKFDDPEVSSLIDTICEKTLKSGKLLGAYGDSNFIRWRQRGIQWMTITNDIYAMVEAYRTKLLDAKSAFEK